MQDHANHVEDFFSHPKSNEIVLKNMLSWQDLCFRKVTLAIVWGNQSDEEKNGCRKISELGWVRGYNGFDQIGGSGNGKKWMDLRDIYKVVNRRL